MKFYNCLIIKILVLFSFVANAQRNADCVKAKEICKKGTHDFATAKGEGSNNMEAFPTPCFMNGDVKGNAEMNSVWIKFTIAKSGSLKFTIRPNKYDDDLDFVLYRLGSGSCSNKQIIRCMAAGDKTYPSYCMGPTGLRDGEGDVMETAGCDGDKNGYLKPVNAKEGEVYVLLVSNVTTGEQGFSVRFFGTCMLPCDEEKKKKEEEPKPIETPTPPVSEPMAEKPAVVTTPTQATPPVVAETPKTVQPSEIEGRKTVVNKTLAVKNRRINLKVWDSSVEDGDMISIYINGKKKFSNITLTTKPQEFLIDLETGENFITAHVESFGKREPNTAAISVNDGKKEQRLTLNATRNQEETMKVIVE